MIRAPMMVSRLRRGLEKMTKNDDMKGVLRELAEEAMITGEQSGPSAPPSAPNVVRGGWTPSGTMRRTRCITDARSAVMVHARTPGASSPVPVLAVATVETRVFRVTTSNKLPSTPGKLPSSRPDLPGPGRGALPPPSPGLSPWQGAKRRAGAKRRSQRREAERILLASARLRTTGTE